MKSKMKYMAAAVCAAIVLAGCNDKGADSSTTDAGNSEPAKPAAVKAEQATKAPKTVARVDDAVYTVEDLKAEADLRCALASAVKKLSDKAEKGIRAKVEKTAGRRFIQQELLLKYFRQENLALDDGIVDKSIDALIKQTRIKSIEQLESKLGPESMALLRKNIEKDAKEAAARRDIRSKANATASDEEVAEWIEKIKNGNEVASLTNALIYATATNVYERLKEGSLTFEEAVQDYSEADEESVDGNWNTFYMENLHSMDEKALIELLPGMDKGDITPPIESDNGLAIVKLVDVQNYTKDRANNTEVGYDLARIFFRLPMFIEIPTTEEMRKALVENKENEFFKEVVQKLSESSQIEGLQDDKVTKRLMQGQ